MEGALRRALPMAPQRHLVVRDALEALAGPPFALACPDIKAKCAARSEPSAADRCNEPQTETAEVRRLLIICSTPAAAPAAS